MPWKKEFTQSTAQGETEEVQVNILSELIQDLIDSGKVVIDGDSFVFENDADMIVIGIPDTGKGKFVPSKAAEGDKKATKACFVIAEMGGWQAGEGIDFRQSHGDVEGLPLTVRMSIVGQVPNTKGTTIDEALNRKPQLVEVPKTGTNG